VEPVLVEEQRVGQPDQEMAMVKKLVEVVDATAEEPHTGLSVQIIEEELV
jgi:hypothetical protein